MKKLVLLIITTILSFCVVAYGLEKPTHMAINQDIATRKIDEFALDTYLTNQLGFLKGIKEELNNKQIIGWLSEGGKTEDEPSGWILTIRGGGRSNNHFHNPLKPWNEAGLNDTVLGKRYTGQSQVLWAQNPNQDPGGQWSWHDARKYFYAGLTSTIKSSRDSALANTFRCLGQLMHLIQDASVPSHVRNDIHIFYHYEKWLENIRTSQKKENLGKFNNFIQDPIPFDSNILNRDPNGLAKIPIAKIVDTGQYNNDRNPNVTVTRAIGIAEYTNANFFSEDTIFSKAFPYPAPTSAQIVDNSIFDPRDKNKMTTRQYYLKKDQDGDTGYRLAVVTFMQDYIYEQIPEYIGPIRYSLDDVVYEDYAQKLLPRAVGYSAGLLKYFFRGELQVTSVPLLYKNGIHYLRVKIKNITPTQETMKNGHFILIYRYTPTGGKPDGSDDIFGQAWGSLDSPLAPCNELKYKEDEISIDFMIYPDLIPTKNYDSVKFTLVFKGTLGNEEKAVIGKSLTLGEIKFTEEWDNGLNGNHTWAHTSFNLFDQNPGNGSTANTIVGDTLIKDNIRYVRYKTARVNESFLDDHFNNGQFKDILPILITPNTYLEFKIDAMSINQIPPAPPGTTNHWQSLMLHFNHGLSLQMTQEGQGMFYTPKTATYTFGLGLIIVDNIYQLFQNAGITIPDGPLYLKDIGVVQQLFILDALSTVEHHQHMEIDSIRIIESKEQ
jgi:hypothetical protein